MSEYVPYIVIAVAMVVIYLVALHTSWNCNSLISETNVTNYNCGLVWHS